MSEIRPDTHSNGIAGIVRSMSSPEYEHALAVFKRRDEDRAGKPMPTIAEMRAGFRPGGERFEVPGDVVITPVNAGGVPAHWIDTPGMDASRVILYLHGGGFQLGDIVSHGELVQRIGRAAKMRVLFVDYRMAPEHPFPAPLDDVTRAWAWLRKTGLHVAFAGDSAGGNLALALAQETRAHAPRPFAIAVMSPWTDVTCSGASFSERATREHVLSPQLVRNLAKTYIGSHDAADPRISPLFGSFEGLPPMLVQVGSEEILFSDSERLVERANAAGASATLHTFEDVGHVFQSTANAPEAQAATDEIGAFLQRCSAAISAS